MSKKGIRTTLIGVVGTLCFIALLVFYFMGKMTVTDFAVMAPCLGTFITLLVSLSAKDSNKTHTTEEQWKKPQDQP